MSRKSDLTPQEKIAIVGCMILGREYINDAYFMSHPKAQTKAEASIKVMVSRWWASDSVKAFREQVQDRITRTSINDGNDLKTRTGIINELVGAVKEAKGKEAISGLQSLAKLQGYDKPDDDRLDDERRTFFVPYPSKCRACQLMKIFREIEKD